jgi:hypothetical protein
VKSEECACLSIPSSFVGSIFSFDFHLGLRGRARSSCEQDRRSRCLSVGSRGIGTVVLRQGTYWPRRPAIAFVQLSRFDTPQSGPSSPLYLHTRHSRRFIGTFFQGLQETTTPNSVLMNHYLETVGIASVPQGIASIPSERVWLSSSGLIQLSLFKLAIH